MKKNTYLLVIVLVQLVFFNGCIEVIEFDTEREGGIIVIDGSVKAGNGPFELKLRETAQSKRISFPVSGATVTLYNDQGASAVYTEEFPGKYILPANSMVGEPGRAYHVQVVLSNGKTYESEPEVIPRVAGRQDSIYFEFTYLETLNDIGNLVSFPVVNAYIDATIDQQPGENLFFRWDVEEVYLLSPTDFPDPFGLIPPPCFVYDYPYGEDLTLIDGRTFKSATINGMKVATQIVDFRFDEKHYFTSYQVGLSEKAFTYWSRIRQTVANVGTIFDAPPAAVRGNVFNPADPDEVVLGYFEAVTVDTIRRYTLPSDTHVPSLKPCLYLPWVNSYPGRCLDCLSLPNSTLKRPDFF